MTDRLSKAGSLIGDFDFGAWGGKMEGMVHTATKLASYMAPTDSHALDCCRSAWAILAQVIAPSIRSRSSLGSCLSIAASSRAFFSGAHLMVSVFGFMWLTSLLLPPPPRCDKILSEKGGE